MRRYIVILSVTIPVLLLLACITAGIAIRQDLIPPPAVEIQVGPVGLETGVTSTPDCPRTRPGCLVPPSPNPSQFFTVWVSVATEQDGQILTTSRRVLSLPIGVN